MDDLGGIVAARDGFVGYPQPMPQALQVPDWGRDVLWYDATGFVPPYGWPAHRVAWRWLLPAVAQVFDAGTPSVIRTVTASWRLLSRRESQRRMADQQLNTLTRVARDHGKVTTGEDQQQADAGQQVLYDLRHQSSGVVPSVRRARRGLQHRRSPSGSRPASAARDSCVETPAGERRRPRRRPAAGRDRWCECSAMSSAGSRRGR